MASPSRAAVITLLNPVVEAQSASAAIQLHVSGGEQVRGFNFRIASGDGLGDLPEPIFVGIDYAGSIWDSFDTEEFGGVVDAAPQFLQAGVVLQESNQSVAAEGILATLLVDTRGFDGGQFSIEMENTAIGQPSDFILAGGGTVTPTFDLASITISAIPEPNGSLILSAIFAKLFFGRRKRTTSSRRRAFR
ncbi:MAG: hypothetical protein AAFX06_32275, partial [Planctomycetota bacterium]